jgi:LmbE family N-acetylglucosaminyl deacetylase
MSDPRPPLDLLVLSPHLDDAALSVGGLIASRAAAGQRVLIATLMTADEPTDPPSALARTLYRAWGLDGSRKLGSLGPMAARRAEDRASAAILGAEAVQLDFADALYRTDAAGRALYSKFRHLFRAVHAADAGFAHRLSASLADLVEREAPAEVLAPLAVGGHVDHRLTRRAAEALPAATAVSYYEDYPYLRRFGAVWWVTRPRSAWRVRVETVSGAALARKIEAIAAFTSQLAPLFGDRETMASTVTGDLARRGGERLWALPR